MGSSPYDGLLLLNPGDPASGWEALAGGGQKWTQSAFVPSQWPELHSLSWDEDSDSLIWEVLDASSGEMVPRFFLDNGTVGGLAAREGQGAGLASEIFFDC